MKTAQSMRPDLFRVKHAPPEMLANIGRDCYLKLVGGMSNPHNVEIDGVPVAPLWRKTGTTTMIDKRTTMIDSEPTDQPRLFRIDCLQKDYKGDVCYRIHAYGGDTFGRCAGRDEIILTKPISKKLPE